MKAAPLGGRCGTHARKASCRDPIGPDDMTITPNTDEHATRVADLETQYLIALMRRDARVFAERAEARDAIVAREAPTRTNPQTEKAPTPSLSIFEDSFAVLR
jgi:hypothetical protein